MFVPHQMGLKEKTAVFTDVRKLDICGFVLSDAALKTWLHANKN